MASVEHIRTLVLVIASLITPATRPPAIGCPCGGSATLEHVQGGVAIISCTNCGGVLCVAGDKSVAEVKAMWHRRQRGFYDWQ